MAKDDHKFGTFGVERQLISDCLLSGLAFRSALSLYFRESAHAGRGFERNFLTNTKIP